MSTITTIQSTDVIANSRADINTNFSNLNTDKLEASSIAALTAKTTPVNADTFPIVDSQASNVLKSLSFTNLKAFLKTYLDTLYPSGSGTSTGTNTGDQTISDATISTTDITTNDVSTSKHGFAPKAPNDATKFLDGTGAYSVPGGGSYSVNADETVSAYSTYEIPMTVLTTTTIRGWTVAGFDGITGTAGGSIYLAGGSGAVISTSLPGSAATDAFSPSLVKAIRIKFRLRVADTSDRKGWGMCVTPAHIYTAQSDVNNGEVRFVLNGATLYAQNANGTATSTDISSGITVTNYNVYEIVFTPGTNIKFYINGVLKATHTTNLPTTGTLLLAIGDNTNGREFYTHPPTVSIQN